MRTAVLAIAVLAGLTACKKDGGSDPPPPLPSAADVSFPADGTFWAYSIEIDYDGPARFNQQRRLDGFDPDAVIPVRLVGETESGQQVQVDMDPRFQIEVLADESEGCFELRGGPATGYWIQGNGCDPVGPGDGGRDLVIIARYYETPTSSPQMLIQFFPMFMFSDDPGCGSPSGYMFPPCL